jgi:AcrR family transcriptional regulator
MEFKKKKEKQIDTTRRIMDTAAEVFAQDGFAGARMDDIADRAGVNKATIYYHIGDKETLYTGVLHEHFASAGDQFDRILQPASTPEEKLSLFIQQVARVMDQNPHKTVMMLREIAAGGKYFPDIVARDLAVIIGKLMEILSEGEKQGRFIPVNPFSVHLMVIGAFALYRVSEPVREKILGLSDPTGIADANISGDFADEIERLVLRAIKTDPDPPEN